MGKKKIFAEALEDTIKSETILTENGAVGYKASKSYLVDFNYGVGSFRNKTEREIEEAFADAYNENPLLAIKLMFLTGDVRQGMGERRTFRTCLNWLATYHKENAKKILSLIPEYSRWDILVDLLDTSVGSEAFDIIKNQLDTDSKNFTESKPISLLAKWLPSVNTSSKIARTKARSLCTRLGLTERNYRKKLSQLRSYSNVVEVKMSARNWGEIDYESVPSKANILYKEAFERHDEARRNKYLESLEKGEAKINSGVSFPYDIIHAYRKNQNYYTRGKLATDTTLEEMWKALPDYTDGKGANVMCVVDGSGSMTDTLGKSSVTAEDVAKSLGIYFAERMPGQFHNKYITFSENPKLVSLDNCDTLASKIYEADRHTECENTNIEKVFELILNVAKTQGLKQEELPKSILILSDMEFDCCVTFNDDYRSRYSYSGKDKEMKTLFEQIGKKFKKEGYKLPRLIFWNINSRTGAIPMQTNENGVALLSGFSPAIASMVFSLKLDPFEILLEKLNSKRYEAVEKALA